MSNWDHTDWGRGGAGADVSHQQLLTFCSVRREIIGASRHGHLNRCRGSCYSPIMVVMETDALLFSWRKHSTGHDLCSFLNFLQEGVAASCEAQEHEY